MSPGEFWTKVEALCAIYDASVTSGVRSEKRNAQVGGAPQSRHMLKYGRAADLVPDDPEYLEEMVENAYRLGFDYAYYDEDKGHCHVQVAHR